MEFNKSFWEARYDKDDIGWDVGGITTPLKEYFDQMENKETKILIPGCGHAYEAKYLHQQGFTNVYVSDLVATPLERLAESCPGFPKQRLLLGDFFKLEETFELIIEQTFFCSMPPLYRMDYVKHMHKLLGERGRLVGLLFNIPLNTDHPPFGGNKREYKTLFEPYFEFHIFEECYNSIKPREGNEVFINLIRKD